MNMPEVDASYDAANEPPRDAAPPVERAPFPWPRFFLSLLFAVIAWFAFWFTILLAVGLWIFIAISRDPHPEFKNIVTVSARYLSHCLAYALLLRDDKPFPLGPLPSGSDAN
jgi:Domain of unknown function (DUF4389)